MHVHLPLGWLQGEGQPARAELATSKSLGWSAAGTQGPHKDLRAGVELLCMLWPSPHLTAATLSAFWEVKHLLFIWTSQSFGRQPEQKSADIQTQSCCAVLLIKQLSRPYISCCAFQIKRYICLTHVSPAHRDSLPLSIDLVVCNPGWLISFFAWVSPLLA